MKTRILLLVTTFLVVCIVKSNAFVLLSPQYFEQKEDVTGWIDIGEITVYKGEGGINGSYSTSSANLLILELRNRTLYKLRFTYVVDDGNEKHVDYPIQWNSRYDSQSKELYPYDKGCKYCASTTQKGMRGETIYYFIPDLP